MFCFRPVFIKEIKYYWLLILSIFLQAIPRLLYFIPRHVFIFLLHISVMLIILHTILCNLRIHSMSVKLKNINLVIILTGAQNSIKQRKHSLLILSFIEGQIGWVYFFSISTSVQGASLFIYPLASFPWVNIKCGTVGL